MPGPAHLRGSFSSSSTTTTHPRTTTNIVPRPPSLVLLQSPRRAISRLTTHATPTRRDAGLMLGAGLVATAAALLPSAAAKPAHAEEAQTTTTTTTTTSPTTYSDPVAGFTLTVPAGWSSGEGSLSGNTSFSGATGSRRAVAFFDASDPQTSVVVVVGTTSPEFTKMSSFGTPITFGSALVNSMDRGFLLRAPAWVRAREAGPGGAVQVARLLDAKEVAVPGADGGEVGYLTDYTIAQVYPEEEDKQGLKRRLVSVAALHTTAAAAAPAGGSSAPAGRGGLHRILTVTAQTTNGDDEARVAALRAIVESFRIA
jgi:hypothetical protein